MNDLMLQAHTRTMQLVDAAIGAPIRLTVTRDDYAAMVAQFGEAEADRQANELVGLLAARQGVLS